jgi:hypothetical protein
MIKIFLPYAIWTFVSVFILKSGLDSLMERNTGFFPAFFITMFVHITIIFPLISSKKQDENS